MPSLRVWVWFIALIAALSRTGGAAAATPWHRDPILSQLLVKQMVTDQAGMRWVATNEGVFRYDGYDLVPLRRLVRPGTGRVPDRNVWLLVLDRAGRLWLGAEQGLFRFTPRTGALANVPLPPAPKPHGDGIGALFVHPRSGQLWVGYETAVLVLDPDHPERSLGAPRQVGGGPLYFQADGSPDGVWLSLRQPNWPMRRIYNDVFPPGAVQLAPSGPVRRQFTTDCFVVPLPGTEPLQLFSASALFVATPDGKLREIRRWLAPGNEDNFVPLGAGPDSVRDWVSQGHRMRLSRRGQLIGRVAIDTIVFGTGPIDHRHSYVLEQDPLGVQWCYSQFWRGCYKQPAVRQQVVQPVGLPNGRPTPSTRAIARLPDGRLLLGAYGGPLVQAADSPNAPLRPLRVVQDGVVRLPFGYDLLVTRDQRVIFCEDRRGFSLFDTRAGELHALPYDADSLPAHAHTLLEDAAGCVWGGTSNGLFQLSIPKRRALAYRTGPAARVLAGLEIIDLAEDRPSGKLWLATAQGLYLLAPTTGELRRVGDAGSERALPTKALLCVAGAGPGRAWVGTGTDGLLLVDARAGVVRRLSLAEGMPSRTVATVVVRPDGVVWAGTFAGLVRYEPASQRLAVLSQADGLIDAEMNRNSAYADPLTGALWFGGVGGLHRVWPTDVADRAARVPARLLVTALATAAADQHAAPVAVPLRSGQVPGLQLAAGPTAFVELQLALSHLLAPDQTHYAYRLLQPGGRPLTPWLPTTRRLVLRGLEAGDYLVEARAETMTGQPAANTVRVPLHVARVWWQHPLAWALGAGLLVLLGYSLFWLQGLRARRDARLREELAANLHDEVGALLTKISLMAEVLQQQLVAPAPAETAGIATTHLTGRLLRSSRDAVQAMRDVVWSIDSRADSVPALLDRMQDFLDQTTPGAGLEYTFEADGQARLRPLRPMVRKQLYLIFKEAVTNVLRHARGASTIQVRLQREASGFVLEVTDDGTVVVTTGGRSGLGLRNMMARAKALDGKLTTGPRPDGLAGYQVRLWVRG